MKMSYGSVSINVGHNPNRKKGYEPETKKEKEFLEKRINRVESIEKNNRDNKLRISY